MGDMTADLSSKPLQGIQFKKFRDTILNVQCYVCSGHDTQECVEKSNNRLRDVRISDLGVSWKWPVSKVVSRDHRQTQYQSKQPPMYQSWQPLKFTSI